MHSIQCAQKVEGALRVTIQRVDELDSVQTTRHIEAHVHANATRFVGELDNWDLNVVERQ
jgi:hypothetical protein